MAQSTTPSDRPLAIVMAAGKGTRMKSELPKVLVEIAGRPMIEFVLDALRRGGVGEILVVVGYRGDDVRRQLGGRPEISFVEQPQQLGTGHAVMMCREELERRSPVSVLIVTGDSPLMQSSSISALLEDFRVRRPACLLGTTRKDNPKGLGRIVRDAQGHFARIVEEKDATPEQRAITEVNMSTYVFDRQQLLHALNMIRPDNVQGEYYITDCPGVLKSEGKLVEALPVLKPCESLSINTVDDLAISEAELKRQLAAKDAG